MKVIINRRSFLKKTAVAGIGINVLPSYLALGKEDAAGNKPPSQRVNLAYIGSGGWIAQHAWNYVKAADCSKAVAFCDVDRNQCAENMKNWRTDEPFFEDFREMLDKMHKDIDAVVVSTPDHCHFAATLACMEKGIHVYTQKPLVHNLWQARTLRKAKNKYNVVTQMGNQGHANSGTRTAVEFYRAGHLGKVSEVIAGNSGPNYQNSKHWVNPKTMPPPPMAVPDGLNYDLWLGPIKKRPYSDLYLPQRWRSFYDFSSGMLGDFGCHTMDIPVWSLELKNPTSVECKFRTDCADGVVTPASIVEYIFPATDTRGPVTLTWYDGTQNGCTVPKIEKFGFNQDFGGAGAVMVGEKGVMQSGSHGGNPRIYPIETRRLLKDKPPKELFPRVAGGNPFKEWLDAVLEIGPEPLSNFDYASELTEIVLLGALAQRFNGRIEWDAVNGVVTNRPELNEYVNEPVRKGWEYGVNL